MNRALVLCAIFFCVGAVLADRIRFQKFRYDPWTGRTTSVEEFDEDVRNMDSRKLQKYMSELRRVKNGLEDMRRESDILERELGFGLGGFPSLMDNSESIIKHALDSVSDQLQRRIGHQDPKLLQNQQELDNKVRSLDRPTLQKNLERLQQTKKEITEAKQRAEALKNDLGFDFDKEALQRAETAVDQGMQVINHRIQKLDHPHQPHQQVTNANVTNTIKKVDNALQTADQQRLTQFDNEFKKMRQYMDNVVSQLNNFHRDIGFEFDGIFEPFKMADSILSHGLNTINRQLHGQGQGQAQQGQGQGQQQGAYNQQNPAPGQQQQQQQQQQGTPQNPPGGAQQQQQGTQQNQQNPANQNQQYQQGGR